MTSFYDPFIASIIVSYIIGSIPFGLVFTRLAGLGDIRDIGSGNIGATNVLRTGNKALALLTLIFDVGKGAMAVLMMGALGMVTSPAIALLFGFAAILGHCFPIWLKFQGGKGVATTFGMLVFAAPFTGGYAISFWLMIAGLFRISSLAALIAMLSTFFTAYMFYGFDAALVCAAITAVIYIRHKENICRLLNGSEQPFGKKK